MSRLVWCLPLVVLLAACGSAGSGGKASPSTTTSSTTTSSTTTSSTTTSVPAASGLRGVAVEAWACPAHVVSPTAKPASIGAPQAFLLCGLEMPGQPAKNVTVVAGGTAFSSLVSALSRPGEPAPGPGTVCAAYADLLQVVLARTSTGVYQVSIPVDGCLHYERAALTALQAARAAG